MICSVITVPQICVALTLAFSLSMICVALTLAFSLSMAVESGYMESYMKMIENNGLCVSDASHVLTTPCLSYCVQICLFFGQACQVLSYSETDNKCQISENCATIPCGITQAKTFQNFTCFTQTPAILTNGSTIVSNSPQFLSYAPEYVIDGLTEQASTTQCFISTDSDPFVTLDLGGEFSVVNVAMWSRTGTSGYDYAKDMDIRVSTIMAGLVDPAALCHYRPGTPTERPEIFNCTYPITGRYMRAGRTTSTGPYFSIAELIVYGY